jgi:sigma-54 dependent transcriptional regulator, acetoin dehydrogenase operon transcriptional activator AcoR
VDELAADGSRTARARLRFLRHDEMPVGAVRRPVLASWVRSRRRNLPVDRVGLSYVADPDLDQPLARSATPVLRRLHEHLDGQPISVILTERNGLVVRRLTADAQLSRYLDRVHLAPGFSYSEQLVGTNGIGTALECGGPMHIFGHEHYAADLEDLACVGVPIKHPSSGKTVGAVGLTCWRRDAGSLLITLAKITADQIRAALLTDSSAREEKLLREYLLAGRRPGDMVLAVNDELLLMNAGAQQTLDGGDQAAVLAHAADLQAQTDTDALAVELPSGRRMRITCRPVPEAEPGSGTVIQLTEQGSGQGVSVRAHRPPPRPELPGIVGRSASWLGASRAVDNAYRTGQWIVVSGEAGAGKLAVARAAHQQNNPAGSFHVVDAAEASDHFADDVEAELTDDTVQALVIRHADRLDATRLDELVGALHSGRERRLSDPPWVALTVTSGRSNELELGELLTLFPSTVDVPPLRHHIDDVRELAPYFLSQLSHGDLTCSPEAMHQLLRSAWPGNTEELHQVLKHVVQHRRRTGVVVLADLPADLQAISRRSLSQLEALERDAIIRSLLDNNGNRRNAARSLGMSRATIYRKIHDYGIR